MLEFICWKNKHDCHLKNNIGVYYIIIYREYRIRFCKNKQNKPNIVIIYS